MIPNSFSPLNQRLFSETEQFIISQLLFLNFAQNTLTADTVAETRSVAPDVFHQSCTYSLSLAGWLRRVRGESAELPLTDFVVQLLHVWDLRLHFQVQPLLLVVSRAVKTASRVATIARAPSLNCVFDWQRKNLSLGVNCGSVNTIYNPNVNRHLVKRLKSMTPSIAGGSTKHSSNNEFCLLISFLWTVQIFKYLM